MNKIVEKYFFKMRYIILYKLDYSYDCLDVNFCSMTYFNMDKLYDDGLDTTLKKHLDNRANCPEWIFFWCVKNNKLAGYSFIHVPSKIEWNDSLPSLPGHGRISSNFVYPEFRRRGIRNTILNKQIEYGVKNNIRLWSVVEQSNIESLRAELKKGYVWRRNILVKCFRKNIISILNKPFEFYILLGSRRARR